MYLTCESHYIFYSTKILWNCRHCSKNLQYFCTDCKEWYYCTYKNKHESTQKHLKNTKNENDTDQITLYTFFYGKTRSVSIKSSDSIGHLKSLILNQTDTNLNENSYFINTVKDNILCKEDQKVSDYFTDNDFYTLNEKLFLDKIIDEVSWKIRNFLTFKETKTTESTPLLKKSD